jgi:hypothetical protein
MIGREKAHEEIMERKLSVLKQTKKGLLLKDHFRMEFILTKMISLFKPSLKIP